MCLSSSSLTRASGSGMRSSDGDGVSRFMTIRSQNARFMCRGGKRSCTSAFAFSNALCTPHARWPPPGARAAVLRACCLICGSAFCTANATSARTARPLACRSVLAAVALVAVVTGLLFLGVRCAFFPRFCCGTARPLPRPSLLRGIFAPPCGHGPKNCTPEVRLLVIAFTVWHSAS